MTAVILAAGTSVTQAALIAHYKFDETSGTTAVNSVSGAADGVNNNGTVINQPGISGRAYSFDGVDDYIQVDASLAGGIAASINSSHQFTMSFWVNNSTTVTTLPNLSRDVVVSIGSSVTNNLYSDAGVLSTGGVITAYGRTRNGSTIVEANGGTTAVNGSTWNLITLTVDDTTNLLTLYVNGAVKATSSAAFAINSSIDILRVGALARPSLADYYTGLVDDVQIYDQALSDTQVTFLFNNPGQVVPEPGIPVLFGIFGSLALLRKRRG